MKRTTVSDQPNRPELVCLLAFNPSNQLAVRQLGSRLGLAFTGSDQAMAVGRLEQAFAVHTAPATAFSVEASGLAYQVQLTQVADAPRDTEIAFHSLEHLSAATTSLPASLRAMLGALEPHLIRIPYLHLGENDFINKFRPERERNTAIYEQDPAARELYQSQLCAAIKELARQHERAASAPLTLDFGPVAYTIPSHFGFCLGVKNAIERAYETLAANPGRRVFMLSELIHNSFVNNDLLGRGLRYLQTDKGVPYTIDGVPADIAPDGTLIWDTLTSEDIVIIPAFGATDEDKKRLVRKGIAVCSYDATCMLVEKVWKTARSYGREGYTVVIHGKAEHEETKATFSNTRRQAPALIVRDLAETKVLGAVIARPGPDTRADFDRVFAGKHTPGFDPERHLDRVAVVNQTTLLVNETRAIIEYLKGVYEQKFGPEGAAHVGGSNRTDTLCYATQVNQDALARALEQQPDAAFVIGGMNSSNTYQLYRLCEHTLGAHAYFIQSERNILSLAEVDHYVFPAAGPGAHGGRNVRRPLWPGLPGLKPRR
ncbi:MAG: 4-hydroxy-3-methylbut-2-enyl diphosphate reductase, partial [Opitutales bacterium]